MEGINKIDRNIGTQDFKKEDESKENKKEIFKLDFCDKEYNLDYKSSNFEYPENIQKETGIIGYERKIIDENSLFGVVESYFKESGINSQEAREYFDYCLHDIGYKKDWEYENIEKISLLILDVLLLLSKDEYPSYTLNHQIGGYYRDDKKTKEALLIAKKERFFLQQIFSDKFLQEDRNRNNGNKLMNIDETDITFKTFGKKNDKTADLNSNESFLTTGNKGLNFLRGAFFGGPDMVSFGFSTKGDIFEDYMKICLKQYCKFDSNGTDSRPMIIKIMKNIIFDQDYVKEFLKIYLVKTKEKNINVDNIDEWGGLKNKINHTVKVILEQIDINDTKIKEYFSEFFYSIISNDLSSFAGNIRNSYPGEKVFYNRNFDPGREPILPIFINHDEIPQLRWGHAKYAHFINEKGLNFIEFKHAKELPVPIDVKS